MWPALLGATGAVLLIVGCAAPEPAPGAATPTSIPSAAASTAPSAEPVPSAPLPAEAAPSAPLPAESPPAEAPAPGGYGCDSALAYLAANAHPAFALVCPGYAFGGQAVTCINHAPECPNSAVIIINVPCPVAYMNEAANSWTLYTGSGAAIDPFGPSC